MDESPFWIPSKCFQMIGYHRDGANKNPGFYRIIQVWGIVCIIICLSAELFFIKLNIDNVLSVAEGFAPLSTGIISFTKNVTFFVWKDKFYKLMERIKDLSAENNAADVLILKRVNNFDRTVGMAYLISGSLAVVGYCSKPIVLNIVNMVIFGAEFDYGIMPFKSAYPYDITKFPAYELSYAIQCWATFNSFLICVAVDTLFLGSCLNICAHLDILRSSFDGDKQQLVERHKEILPLIKNLCEMIKPVIFTQFFITSMLLCVLGFQIVVLESFFEIIIVISLGIAILIQLFTYCYGGQLIMDKSSSVADHLYETDKDLVIIIRRAHKAEIIKAGFYQATLPTFSSILSSAASLITLLQSFIK